MFTKIIKRDVREVAFDETKITDAIFAAAQAVKRRCFEEASGWIRQSAFKAPVWKSADWDIFYSISMEKGSAIRS